MNNNLSKHILATITYYDVMDYPMTAFEIWKYLTVISGENEEKYSLLAVIDELGGEKLKSFIKEDQGFYMLKDRSDLVEQRIFRDKISEVKFKNLAKMVGFLKFLPFIRMIGVSGRMAMKNAESKSDFDLFIILKKGKIFTGRALITFFAQVLGWRRHGERIKNRLCLNHFGTDEFFIAGKDLFSANDYTFMIPVYGFYSFVKFQSENPWILRFKPNFFAVMENFKQVKETFFSRACKNFLEKILKPELIEKKLRAWQAKKIENNPKTKQEGSMIICEDSELAFWPNFENQGPKIFLNFKERLEKISRF